MSKHTSGSLQGSAAAKAGATAGQALQPEHAFVVQLRGGSSTSRDGLQGRVEHVVSGEAMRFVSTAELVEFLARCAPAAADASQEIAGACADPAHRRG